LVAVKRRKENWKSGRKKGK
jgi:hypothetical protein